MPHNHIACYHPGTPATPRLHSSYGHTALLLQTRSSPEPRIVDADKTYMLTPRFLQRTLLNEFLNWDLVAVSQPQIAKSYLSLIHCSSTYAANPVAGAATPTKAASRIAAIGPVFLHLDRSAKRK